MSRAHHRSYLLLQRGREQHAGHGRSVESSVRLCHSARSGERRSIRCRDWCERLGASTIAAGQMSLASITFLQIPVLMCKHPD